MNTRPTPETDIFQIKGKAHYMAGEFSRNLERQRDEAREQRDRLAQALRKIADPDWMVTEMYAAREIAEQALQSLNQPTKTK